MFGAKKKKSDAPVVPVQEVPQVVEDSPEIEESESIEEEQEVQDVSEEEAQPTVDAYLMNVETRLQAIEASLYRLKNSL